MKQKLTSVLIFAFILLCFSGCRKPAEKLISLDEAKAVITEYSPGCIITDCELDNDSMNYEIEFKTQFGEYEATVSGKNGDILSVVLEEPDYVPQQKQDDEEKDDSRHALSSDDALTIAIMDADVSGSVLTVKNSYSNEDNCYTVIFRSGNKEFLYKIDAATGDILDSAVDMDS